MSTEEKKEELESTETKAEEEKVLDNDDDDNDGGDDEIVLKGMEQDNKEGKREREREKKKKKKENVAIKEMSTKKMIAKDKTKSKHYNVCRERIDDPAAKEIEVREIGSDTLENIVKYLNEHKGEEPPPLPCPVRSTEMSQVVSVKWDADFIDAFDKKAVFEIILVIFVCLFLSVHCNC
ncbi:hypothetical protein RFI_38883 [Reticulomyxa filosa]|uniref:Uncharacterized protein n=1 Tax=Reticulomyxa filosa TaxID=46433 RepID=X6L989_RETFI|nr:hypothetical protein RFI_38883 [Reticulomyxa filosa]|eukprot:ETN98612.1 hypothetical protein RFI_38883 [Reticulomyxa filosa]